MITGTRNSIKDVAAVNCLMKLYPRNTLYKGRHEVTVTSLFFFFFFNIPVQSKDRLHSRLILGGGDMIRES